MPFNRVREQRGAVIIHVAIALAALLAFLSIVIDYGVMWVSRRQAQSAADAGALAGAISLVKEGDTATAKLSAGTFAAQNVIWGENNTYDGTTAGNVSVDVSGTAAGEMSLPPCGTTKGCVRVDIFRNEPDRPERSNLTRGNPLPTFFARLLGITQQGVRATATAQAGSGNSVRCLLPFGVIDRWSDNFDDNVDTTYFPNDGLGQSSDPTSLTGIQGWTQNDEFQPTKTDYYVPPYNNNPNHTGWRVNVDYGRQLIIKAGSLNDKVYSSGWALQVDLPNSTGSQDYKWNIENCNPQGVGIAPEAATCSEVDWEHGCLSIKTGMAQGPTDQGIEKDAESVVEADPDAHWNPTYVGVAPKDSGLTGAVLDKNNNPNMSSPRIRPIAVIDIGNYMSQGCSGTTCIGKVANIIGFFVEGMCKDVTLDNGNVCPNPTKDVVGRIVTLPGTLANGVGTTDPSAAFITVIRLVR
jgi:hypothetical protein